MRSMAILRFFFFGFVLFSFFFGRPLPHFLPFIMLNRNVTGMCVCLVYLCCLLNACSLPRVHTIIAHCTALMLAAPAQVLISHLQSFTFKLWTQYLEMTLTMHYIWRAYNMGCSSPYACAALTQHTTHKRNKMTKTHFITHQKKGIWK